MDAPRWRRLQEIFAQAHAVAGEERERLLRELAAAEPDLVVEVRTLLAADAQGGIMDVVSPRLTPLTRVLEAADPDRVGAYRVIRELGRGGMGVVYLAARADGQFDQQVAIKLIGATNADDPLHRRFLAERQILAGLTHPNIARLLDGGITDDGRPYFVLEYVDGLPITAWCDAHRLDVRARLRLFADVCAAVQHAHQNLVIHRDLKPTNILVSHDGRVHLLDFGIAKLIDPTLAAASATRHELRAMTPEYASPEQVRGDPLTTASDIYSLGVLLYVLLCGHPPYRLTSGSLVEVTRAVVEQDPERPSARAARREIAAESRGTTSERL
ncbi:MAG TPA: serine/threonine-protein kinase, partial [Gemmatimonadaceae bacterium]|nr:serine/threonine-protein kinase [Gemmatimonadaceae bacterium]